MPRPRLSILVLLAVLSSGSLEPGLVSQEAPKASEPTTTATPRTTSLQGTAIFTRNRPVAGATVVVSTRSGDAVPRILVTATDAKGTFRLDGLSEGSYDVEFLRDGLETLRKEKVEVRAPFRSIVEVTMKLAYGPPPAARARGAESAEAASLTLEGSAAGRDGKPIADVLVRLMRRDAAADPREARSGPDGAFALGNLAPGEFELESGGLGLLPVRAHFRLDGPAQLRLVLVSQPTLYEPSPVDLIPREEPIPPPAG